MHSYEQLKKELLQRRHGVGSTDSTAFQDGASSSGAKLDSTDLLLASTASKVCAILGTYPYQVVRSCVQQRQVIGTDSVAYSSAGGAAQHIWRIEGIRGFYRGIWAHMLRSTPQATVTLMIYEHTIRALQLVGSERLGRWRAAARSGI